MTHEKSSSGSCNRPENYRPTYTQFCQDFLRPFVVKLAAKVTASSRFVTSVPSFKNAFTNLSDTSGTAHSLTYPLIQKTATP